MNNEMNKTREESANELRYLCDLFNLSPKNLKTKIDIFSRDKSGNKLIIGKKNYNAEDLLENREDSQFYDNITKSIMKECNISEEDLIGLTYFDKDLNPRTLVIEITNFVEKTEDIKV